MEALRERKQRDIWNDGLDEGDLGMNEDITRIEEQMKEGFAAVDKRFEKVDERFDKVDERFQKTPTREEMNEGFAGLRSDFAALNRTLIASAGGIIGTLIAGFIALVVTHAA